ncbi:hypothetical protein BV22DRAFT_450303 [Leucogyrophana mollusca]|uniref:Uncharacterized protein n=1 Tax=Leucogyrophana mollusca TaxID=85980 RepID=A0ACB8BHF1_9AGAM|nr:hypothetical protein BV22DRAFT_450303 [Leucogyrophana mollusca]
MTEPSHCVSPTMVSMLVCVTPWMQDLVDSLSGYIARRHRRCRLLADISVEAEIQKMVDRVVETCVICGGECGDQKGGLDFDQFAGFVVLTWCIPIWFSSLNRGLRIHPHGQCARNILCYKHAAMQMASQGRGGRIIGVSSVAGKRGVYYRHLAYQYPLTLCLGQDPRLFNV